MLNLNLESCHPLVFVFFFHSNWKHWEIVRIKNQSPLCSKNKSTSLKLKPMNYIECLIASLFKVETHLIDYKVHII